MLQRVIGALGRREGEPDRQFMTMPEVAPPEQCPLKPPDAFGHSENMVGQFERRTVLEDFDSGLEYVWTRARHRQPVSAALLAAVSDFFLGAHKRSRGGTSLDNTLRLCSLHPTEWILCTTQVAGFANGVMQGSQCFFSQDGALLAISSQSGLLPHTPNP